MYVAAVTGTNGKTSVVEYVRQLLRSVGVVSASLGSLGFVSDVTGREPYPVVGSTPEDLRTFVDRLEAELGIEAIALEAFSPALAVDVHAALDVAAGGFTNLTPEHLSHHGTMEAYEEAKARLFTKVVRDGGVAVVDGTTPAGERMLARARERDLSCLVVGGPDADLDLLGMERRGGHSRVELLVKGARYLVDVPMFAPFQVSNALLALGLCLEHEDAEVEALLAALSSLRSPPGRMVTVGTLRGGVVIVDYAHNPGGLATALSSLRTEATGRLLVVLGAGGDRDPGKRAPMGRIAGELADLVVVTDDNPRDEDPAAIRAAIMAGVEGALEIPGRAQAIRHAVAELGAGDVLLVAGKGDEHGIEQAGEVLPFSDVDAAAAAIRDSGGRVFRPGGG